MEPEQPQQAPQPTTAIEPSKAGFVVGLVACAFGVLGIVTPIIGLLFVAIAAVLTVIALIKSIKAKYWPAVGFSVLAVVLVIFGLATSPIFLAMTFGEKSEAPTPSSVSTPMVAPAAAPATETPAAPDYIRICTDKMVEYALKNQADPAAYVANNQAYLHQCADHMAKQSLGAQQP